VTPADAAQVLAAVLDDRLPINGTPTLFVNGRMLSGLVTASAIKDSIERALGN